MLRLVAAILLLSFAAASFAIEGELGFDDPALNERYRALLHEVRCPKCLNTSIADSSSLIAADLRREVHEKMAAGATDEQILDYLVSRYGEFVIYRPPLQPTTWALWAGPFVLLAVGALVFVRIVRNRSHQPIEEDPAA